MRNPGKIQLNSMNEILIKSWCDIFAFWVGERKNVLRSTRHQFIVVGCPRKQSFNASCNLRLDQMMQTNHLRLGDNHDQIVFSGCFQFYSTLMRVLLEAVELRFEFFKNLFFVLLNTLVLSILIFINYKRNVVK